MTIGERGVETSSLVYYGQRKKASKPVEKYSSAQGLQSNRDYCWIRVLGELFKATGSNKGI